MFLVKLEKVWQNGITLMCENSLFVPIESSQLYRHYSTPLEYTILGGSIIGSFYTQLLEVI